MQNPTHILQKIVKVVLDSQIFILTSSSTFCNEPIIAYNGPVSFENYKAQGTDTDFSALSYVCSCVCEHIYV